MKSQKVVEIKDSVNVLSNGFNQIECNIIADTIGRLDDKDLIGCEGNCSCVQKSRQLEDNYWSEEEKQWAEGLCECSYNRCGVESNYTGRGLLANWRKPIHECGDNCVCNTSPLLKTNCSNRWTQRPTECLTQLFVDSFKGYSIRTLNDLKFGQFVIEYCGEVIDKIEAKNRFKLNSENREEHNYILIFREHFGETTFEIIIDAKYYGNDSRFINHSCEPNLIALPVRSDSLRPRICLFAAKDIVSGSELSYNYGSNDSLFSNKLCFCGSDNCKRFMPLDIDL